MENRIDSQNSLPPEPSSASFRLSASAAARILSMLERRPDATMIRVGVIGGGCSGFQYEFGFETACGEGDVVFERDGARVVIDAVSMPFLAGAEIDYGRELIGAAFRIDNPNAVAACGCGTSFSPR